MKRTLDIIVVHLSQPNRRFCVDKYSTCDQSSYIARNIWLEDPIIILADPRVFEMFVHWLRRLDSPSTAPPHDSSLYLEEPWLSRTAEAWILAERLEAPAFARFCLLKFIKTCSLAPFGSWHLIESKTHPSSPLRRFSNHWVSWNVSLISGATHEYAGLQAASCADLVTQYTGDPREYDSTHWYLPCGDKVSPDCIHNPAIRRKKVRKIRHPPLIPRCVTGNKPC
jgi:hypothetical protein